MARTFRSWHSAILVYLSLAETCFAQELQTYFARPLTCTVRCEGYQASDLGKPSEIAANSKAVTNSLVDGRFTSFVQRYERLATVDTVLTETYWWEIRTLRIGKAPVIGPVLERLEGSFGEDLRKNRRRVLYEGLKNAQQTGTLPTLDYLIGPNSLFRNEFGESATPTDELQNFVLGLLGNDLQRIDSFLLEMKLEVKKSKATIQELRALHQEILKQLSAIRKTQKEILKVAQSNVGTAAPNDKTPVATGNDLRKKSAAEYRTDYENARGMADMFDGIASFCASVKSPQCAKTAQAGKAFAVFISGVALIAAQQYVQGLAAVFTGLSQIASLSAGGGDAVQAELQELRKLIETLQVTIAANHRQVMKELVRVNKKLDALAQATIDLAGRDIGGCATTLDEVSEASQVVAPIQLRVAAKFSSYPNATRDCLRGMKDAFLSEKEQTAVVARAPDSLNGLWVESAGIARYITGSGRLALGNPPTRLKELEANLAGAATAKGGTVFFHRNVFDVLLDAPKVSKIAGRLADWHFLYEITVPGTFALLSPAESRKIPASSRPMDGKNYLESAHRHVDLALAQQSLVMGHLVIPVLDVLLNKSIDELYKKDHFLAPFLDLPKLEQEELTDERTEAERAALLNERKERFREVFVSILRENNWVAENLIRYRVAKELKTSNHDAKTYLLAISVQNRSLLKEVLPGIADKLVWIGKPVLENREKYGWNWLPTGDPKLVVPLPSAEAVAKQEILYMPTMPSLWELRARLPREIGGYEARNALSASDQQYLKRLQASGIQF